LNSHLKQILIMLAVFAASVAGYLLAPGGNVKNVCSVVGIVALAYVVATCFTYFAGAGKRRK